VHVQPLHAQTQVLLDPLDQLGGGGRGQPELRPRMAGEHVRVSVGGDPRKHADQHVLRPPLRQGRLEPVDVVAVVDHDQADPVLHGHRDLLVALGVAVEHEQPRVCSRLQRGHALAATRHVEADSLLDHHALHRGAGKGLGGENHPRPRPTGGELVDVLAGAGPQRLLRDHERGRPEAGSSSARQPPTSSMPSPAVALPAGYRDSSPSNRAGR
jgi:hypothetical protein